MAKIVITSMEDLIREGFIIGPHTDCSESFGQSSESQEMFGSQKKADPEQLEKKQKAMAEKAIRNAERRSKQRGR